MLFKMPKVCFFLRSNNDSAASSVLYCRVTFNGSSCEFSTSEKVLRTHWHQDRQKLSVKTPQANYIEMLISLKTYKLKTIALSNEDATAKQLVAMLSGAKKVQTELQKIVAEYIEYQTKHQKETTILQHRIKQKNLLEFEKHTRTVYTSKTFDLCTAQNFIDWFQESKNTSNITSATRAVLFFRAAMIWAHHRGKIDAPELLSFRGKLDKTKAPQFLTQKELDKIKSLQLVGLMDQVRDLFLFACNTGISFCDLCGHLEHVQKNGAAFLYGIRAKSGQHYFTPLFSHASDIWTKYDQRLPKVCNQVYNKYLKKIAALANIEKRITTHTARRTFATLMDERGISRETVAKMLGHASIKTTEQYYIGRSFERVEREVLLIGLA